MVSLEDFNPAAAPQSAPAPESDKGNTHVQQDISKKRYRKPIFLYFLLFLILVLTGLRTAEQRGVITLAYDTVRFMPWYGLAIALVTILAMRSRSFISKFIATIGFLLVIAGATAISVYSTLGLENPGEVRDELTAFLSGVEQGSIGINSLSSKTTIDNSQTNDFLLEYNGDRQVALLRTGRSIFTLTESPHWQILDEPVSIINGILPYIPIYSLSIQNVYGHNTLNIADLDMRDIAIDGMVEINRIHIEPFGSDNTLTIRARYTDTHIEIPTDVGIDLEFRRHIGSLNLENFTRVEKKHYQSIGYEQANDKIKIVVDAIRGDLTIDRR